MAKSPLPALRKPGALSLLGLSILCAAASATLLLTGLVVAGGVAALVAAICSFASEAPAAALASIGGRAATPVVDAAILASVAWTERSGEPLVAALALITLGAALVASYERARADALGYTTSGTGWVRLARRLLVGAGVAAGGAWLAGALWTALALAVFTLGQGAMVVVAQERDPVATDGAA
jgi:hypothetical protein